MTTKRPHRAPATAAAQASLALDDQFCFPVYAASNLIQRVYRPLLEPLGLTYAQYLALLVLWEQGDTTVKALGERLFLDSGTLSPLLKRLGERGLVKKSADVDDGRRVVVSLTARGRALKADAARVPEALVCRLLADGGPEAAVKMAALRQQMKGLVAAMDAALRAEP